MTEALAYIIISVVIILLGIGIFMKKKESESVPDDLESPEDKVLVKIGIREHAIMRREDAEIYNKMPRDKKRIVIRKLKEKYAEQSRNRGN